MPWTPTAERLSFTSSSLKGLMIASTFFMESSPAGAAGKRAPRLRQPLFGCKGGARASERSLDRLRRARRVRFERRRTRAMPARERAAVAAGGEHVGVLAVL